MEQEDDDNESSPLIHSAQKKTALDNVERDFIIMSFLWTVGMTCILLPMNYAASVFGTSAGSFFLGLDYTVLTITSVFFAAPFVDYFGPKMSLGLSCFALICYLVCFVVADTVESEALKYAIMSTGMSLDGAFGSIGWVAQGVHYSRISYLYHQKQVSLPLLHTIYYYILTSGVSLGFCIQGIPLTEARDYLVGLFMGITCPSRDSFLAIHSF